MTRKLISFALCALMCVAASAFARSASAGTLYMSINFSGFNQSFSGNGSTFYGDANTVGGAGTSSTPPIWNQAYQPIPTSPEQSFAFNGTGTPAFYSVPVYPGAPNSLVYNSGPQLDTNGNPTSVYMKSTFAAESTYNTSTPAPSTMFDNTLDTHGLNTSAVPALLDLYNVPKGSYSLYLYSQGDNNTGDTFIGVNGSSTWQEVRNSGSGDTTTQLNYVQATPSNPIGNYTVISGIVPNSSNGEIDVAYYGLGSGGNINGIQLVFDHPIPEPSSFVLAGIGLAGAALVARRRRK